MASPTAQVKTPPRTTVSSPAVTKTPAAPKSSAVAKMTPLRTSHTPGPKLLQWMRVGLVVWTLVATVLCLGSILASQAHQESSAASLIHAQDLRDLQSEVSHAHAEALTSFLDSGVTGQGQWDSFQTSRTQIDILLLTSAASANYPEDLSEIASTLRAWQDQLTLAHRDARDVPSDELPDLDIDQVTASFSAVTDAIGSEVATTSDQGSASNPFTVMSILASVLGGVGFVIVSVVVARRSHRVINIGLTIGLLAIIGAIVAVGVYASRSSQISVTDSRIATLAQAQSDTWNTQTLSALSVLDPDSWQSHTRDASELTTLIRANLNGFSGPTTTLIALADAQETLAVTDDTAERSAQVLDGIPWKNAAAAISAALDQERPDTSSLVVPALGYVITVASCCVIAIIATLAGIHARTKEYL